MRNVVATFLRAFIAHAEIAVEKAADSIIDRMKIQNYNMAHAIPDQTTVYEWIKYNEDIDPKMASAAEA